jgi:hypothetical protein
VPRSLFPMLVAAHPVPLLRWYCSAKLIYRFVVAAAVVAADCRPMPKV